MTTPNLNQDSQPNEENQQGTNIEEDQIPPWQAAIYESRQATLRLAEENRQLRERQEAIERERNTPAPIPLEAGVAFNEPEKFMERIGRELDARVAPLNAFVADMTRKNNYYALKSQIVQTLTPQQREIFTKLESQIDVAFIQNPALNPDVQTFQMVLQNIAGAMMLNGQNVNTPAPSSNQPNQPNRQVIPPLSRPSSPPPPAPRSNVDLNSLTETDRRLARERGMSDEEWIIMRDTPPEKAGQVWKEIKAKRGGK